MHIILSYSIGDKLFQEFSGYVIDDIDDNDKKDKILKYKQEKANQHKCEVKDVYINIKNLKKRIMNREQVIEMLLSIGCEDITETMHPGKKEKKYLRYNFNDKSYIDFNFNYEQYDKVFVSANRKHISEYLDFEELKDLLIELKLIN